MIHAENTEAALDWYKKAFVGAKLVEIKEFNFQYLNVNGIQIEIVPADTKVSSGAAGSVVYWEVTDFNSIKNHMISLGAELYRGPMKIENGRQMCQLKDPFKNLIGIRGI